MATVKGKYIFPAGDVEMKFALHLLCDEADPIATCILQHVGEEVWHFARERSYDFQDILDHVDLIERIVLKSQVVSHQESGFLGISYTHSSVNQFVSKIDFDFKAIAASLPRSEVVVLSPSPSAIALDVDEHTQDSGPEPSTPRTITDRFRAHVEERVAILVAISNVTKELQDKYELEMERDDALKTAVTNFLDAERNAAYDP